MKKIILTILMMACAIVFAFSSCKKDKVEKDNDSNTSQNTPAADPVGDGIIENAVTDIDGNTYRAVKLGKQVWMAEWLRTTKYADGTYIPLGNDTSTVTAFRYNPDSNSNIVNTYGYLYNWKAVMHNSSSSSDNPSGVQGICPNGWHVPSDSEVKELAEYVAGQSQYICGGDSMCLAKPLSSTIGWNSSDTECAPGNDPNSNNATGFNATPSGLYNEKGYSDFGNTAVFWSTTEENYVRVWNFFFSYNRHVFCASRDEKYYAFPIRCVRN